MKQKLEHAIDLLRDVEHVGVSALRSWNRDNLKQLEKPFVLHAHAQPIAVLIPYRLFMAVQAAYLEAEKARREHGG